MAEDDGADAVSVGDEYDEYDEGSGGGMEQGGGTPPPLRAPPGAPWSPSPSSAVAPPPLLGPGGQEAALSFAVRLRPLERGDHDYCLRVKPPRTVLSVPSLAGLSAEQKRAFASAAASDGAAPGGGSSSSGGGGGGGVLLTVNGAEASYDVDSAFGPAATHLEVFKVLVAPLAAGVVGRGGHGCVVACGPRGGGKSHTMAGDSGSPGLFGRALSEVFRLAHHDLATLNPRLLERPLAEQPLTSRREVRISMSLVEVCGGSVRDLLTPRRPDTGAPKWSDKVEVREDKACGVFLAAAPGTPTAALPTGGSQPQQSLFSPIGSAADGQLLLVRGQAQRSAFGSTAVLTIHVQTRVPPPFALGGAGAASGGGALSIGACYGSLTLVDLASPPFATPTPPDGGSGRGPGFGAAGLLHHAGSSGGASALLSAAAGGPSAAAAAARALKGSHASLCGLGDVLAALLRNAEGLQREELEAAAAAAARGSGGGGAGARGESRNDVLDDEWNGDAAASSAGLDRVLKQVNGVGVGDVGVCWGCSSREWSGCG